LKAFQKGFKNNFKGKFVGASLEGVWEVVGCNSEAVGKK